MNLDENGRFISRAERLENTPPAKRDEVLAEIRREYERDAALERAWQAQAARPQQSPSHLHLDVTPTQRRSLDDPADREHARNAALTEAAKHVGKAEAARIADEWLTTGRLDRLVDGRVICAIRCPITSDSSDRHRYLSSEWRSFDIADGARLLLTVANPEAEIARRDSHEAAKARADVRANAEAQKREQRELARRRQLEERAEAWRNAGVNTGAPGLVRALLRNLDHPEHGAMFRALAALAMQEPHTVPQGQQPPDCALELLGCANVVIDE